MSAVSLGFWLSWAAARRGTAACIACAWLGAVVAVGFAGRARGALAVDEVAVQAGYFGVLLPLLAYGWVASVRGSMRAHGPLVEWGARMGLSRRRVTLGCATGVAACVGSLSVAGAALMLVVTGLWREGWWQWSGTAGLAVQSGVAYALCFAGAELLWPRSALPLILLIVDWLFGEGGPRLLPLPRAQVAVLSGAWPAQPRDLFVAHLVLLGTGLLWLGAGLWRTRP